MGLIENCNRVKQNVENIYTVLEENGIVIPDGTTSDNLDELIDITIESSGGADTSDATATADEIFSGETAYTADGKTTGTFTIEEEITEQNDLISQINTALKNRATYNTLYITTSTPTDDMGVDGDICIVKEVI